MTDAPVSLADNRRWAAAGRVRRKRIAVVGSGVVGTATGEGLARKGHDVVFCDIADERLALLRRQGLHAVDPDGLCEFERDAYLISVPSPTVEGRADTSYVESATAAVGRAMQPHANKPLVVVRSTVLPGTTEELVAPIVERVSGRVAGHGFGLCMNPEFLRELSALEDFLNPRVIVIGALDEWSDSMLRAIYTPWSDVATVSMSIRTAEATKYTANVFNATKISFFNELEQVFALLGVDARAAFAAAAKGAEGLWNPEYGTRGLFPWGGACLPKDTSAFLTFAQELDGEATVSVLAAAVAANDALAAEEQPIVLSEWRAREQPAAS